MADIKTRDIDKGSIKTLNKAAIATERMKHAYISTKEKTEQSTHASEDTVDEYASNRFESTVISTVHKGIYQVERTGRKSVQDTRENYHKVKDGIQNYKEKRASRSLERQAVNRHGKGRIKAVQQSQRTVKESVRSAGNKTIKTTTKGVTKTASKSVKTAEKTAKTTIKTTKQVANTVQKTAQATAKASQKAVQAAKASAKATATAIKAAVKATVTAVKAIIAGAKALISAIAAGGWIAVVIIIIICLIAFIFGSVYGVFFSGEDSGSGMTMQTVVQEINAEYDMELDEIRSSETYDVLEMSGSRAVWKDVLAVYSVKVNTDPDNPQEVATMDDNKKELLKDIFWQMNTISSRTETRSETVVEETDDGHGNILQTETTVRRKYLYITVSHKTAQEMAEEYDFSQEQKDYLEELLKDENNSLWSSVLYGITTSDDQIVSIALSQIGNVGGQPYWSWYGFDSRVEWCACFVSWCANECGYIDTGIIPKYSVCDTGVNWFKERSQWLDGNEEPTPGMIIFFDWAYDGLDGNSDHTGIVEKVENGMVYTVEGNSGDVCKECSYPVGYFEILGYGAPAY